jgi:hypothetical protein
MMKTPMGIAAKNLTASDDASLMPDPVNARTRPQADLAERRQSGLKLNRNSKNRRYERPQNSVTEIDINAAQITAKTTGRSYPIGTSSL